MSNGLLKEIPMASFVNRDSRCRVRTLILYEKKKSMLDRTPSALLTLGLRAIV